MYISGKKIKNVFISLAALAAIFLLVNNTSIILKRIYPTKYEKQVYLYSKQFNIDPLLVFAIIKAESGFNPKAVSKKNAMGLMQITPATASEGASKLKLENFKTDDLYDPNVNIMIGCWYLNWLIAQFDGNVDLAIVAYNGGIGNVRNWLEDKKLSKDGLTLDKIPFKETDQYLKRVKDYYYVYKKLYKTKN